MVIVLVGLPKFYSRFEFEPAIDYGIKCRFNVPERYFMVKHHNNEGSNLLGKISYPDAFQDVRQIIKLFVQKIINDYWIKPSNPIH